MKSLTLLALLFVGCAKTLYVPVERTITITETLRDTVVITKLERETTTQRSQDTSSTVETRFATSTATWHGSTNELEHSLTTKDTPFEVRVQYVERVVIDSIPAPYPVEVQVEIEKPVRLPLRWWEQTLLWFGIVAFTAVGIWAVRKVKR